MNTHKRLNPSCAEFVQDIETAYPNRKELAHEWPDLLITYNKAVRVLREAA